MDYERRQIYRGPEKFINLPANPKEAEDAIDDALADHPDNGDVMSAVVLEASARKVVAVRGNGETLEVTGEGLKAVQSGLAAKAPPQIAIRRGAVIRVLKSSEGRWEITQLPEVEGALVAMDPRNGEVLAFVSKPTFDPNLFVDGIDSESWKLLSESIDKPLLNAESVKDQ
jgi:penicillin-binding protein 1A